MTRRLAAFVAFALAAPVSAAAGQTVNDLTGAIVGRVTDQTAALLPGVRVEISSPGLMTPFATSTNAEGAYRLLALPPAEYHAPCFPVRGLSHAVIAFWSRSG